MKKNSLEKWIVLLAGVGLVVSMFAGCSKSSANAQQTAKTAVAAAPATAAETKEATATQPAKKEAKDLKVALVLPGTANDKGWNQEAYDGLMEIKKMGCQTACSEKVAASDFESVFRGYADRGYDVVFGHGTEFEDAAKAVAPDYPNTMFCITSSDISQAPNVCSLQNLNNQQGFVAGLVAAEASKSKKVAAIGGMEIPSIQSFIIGFKQGVAYADNGTVAMTAFTGDFDDAAKVKEQANAFIEKGADILTHDADQAGLGLFEAVKDAPEGTYAIGVVKDQYAELPSRVLTSATNFIGKGMAVAVQDYLDGNLHAECYKFGIKEGVIGLADYHDCADVLTAEQKQFITDTMKKVASGEITVKSAQK
ncbi:MAG: BMP family protein [Spirochaetia bacterium]|jgi:basic membrane protein A|nr:BMP family protein [Spirochaetia bacterium]